MSKINKLTFSNYKFFREAETIELGGNHLLLYGENGSGKSSIFWGIHTLLEASLKTKVDVEKYFKPISDSDESLVNIYASKKCCQDTGVEHYNTFIEIEADNGVKQHISMLNKDICGDTAAMESRKTTDFINYQSLFAFQRFKNSQSSNIYKEFNDSILPYIDFDSFEIKGKTLHNAFDMWKEYCAGPGKTRNAKRDEIQVYKHSPEYAKFLEFENHFNNKLSGLIDFINTESKEIIKALGYDIGFKLQYHPPTHNKKDKNYDYHEYIVDFILTQYNGEPMEIRRPHKFLNEAKITAIAIAIRLAVLKYKVQNNLVPNALNVLVLDDIMVSLDMSNRDSLTNLIVNNLANDYQILLLTHDKGLYNYIIKEVSQSGNKSKWIYKKMYVGECEKTCHEFPVIIDEEGDYFTRAEKYFQAKDYTISALCLRKALEKFLVDALPPDTLKSIDNSFIELETLWKKVACAYNLSNERPDIYNSATKIKRVILNPAAHHKREYQPLYRKELKDAFLFISNLKNLNLNYTITTILIEKGQRCVYTHPTEKYLFEFEFESNLILSNGVMNDPKTIIHSWRYNDIEYYSFQTGGVDDSYRKSKPKFSRLKSNLYGLQQLSIDEDNFMSNTFVDGSRMDFLLGKKTQTLYSSNNIVVVNNTPKKTDKENSKDAKTDNVTSPANREIVEQISSRELLLSGYDIERLKAWTSGDDPQFFQVHFESGSAIYGLGAATKYEIKTGKDKIEWDSFFEKLHKLGLIEIEKYNKDGHPVYKIRQSAYEYVENLNRLTDN